jgi:ribonuclease BN (tRNA processing enzyme)
MHLTFLGTGSAMPTGERAQSGLLLTPEGEWSDAAPDEPAPLLVDCGSGVLNALARTEVGYEGVAAVLLTHHHLDHVADLLPLLKARWLAGSDPLPVVGPPGTRALLGDLLAVHDYLDGEVAHEAREVAAGAGFTAAGHRVDSTEAVHSMPSHAYRFGDALAVSGDTEASDDVAAFADGVSVFVHDCSFPDDVDVSNHPTPTRLGEVLEGHAYGRVYLTHLYPHTEGRHDEMLAAVGRHFGGEVRFARDGLTVTVEA